MASVTQLGARDGSPSRAVPAGRGAAPQLLTGDALVLLARYEPGAG